jgi:hypothetical protein
MTTEKPNSSTELTETSAHFFEAISSPLEPNLGDIAHHQFSSMRAWIELTHITLTNVRPWTGMLNGSGRL